MTDGPKKVYVLVVTFPGHPETYPDVHGVYRSLRRAKARAFIDFRVPIERWGDQGPGGGIRATKWRALEVPFDTKPSYSTQEYHIFERELDEEQ